MTGKELNLIKDNLRRIFSRTDVKKKTKFCVAILVISIILAVAVFTVMKYEVEGEKKVPFKIGKIIVISSATTSTIESNQEDNQTDNEQQENEEKYIWEEDVVQTNDIYIYLDKNSECKEQQAIRKVTIDNIQILKGVNVGKVQIYMPSSVDNELYRYVNEYLVNSTLTYTGASADNRRALEIGNQGGCIALSFANVGIGTYKSNDDQEIESGGTILEKMGIVEDDLKFTIAFDIKIEVEDKTYKTTITLDLPIEGVVGQKESHEEITDFEKIIFKRI